MAWCRLEDDFRDNRKPKRLAAALQIPRAHARGLLAGLWSWAVTHAPDGHLGDILPGELAEAADWEGDPMVFWDAMVAQRLMVVGDDGHVSIHKYLERAGSFAEARRKNRQRQAARASENDTDSVPGQSCDSPGLEESRGEERRSEEIRGEQIASAEALAGAALDLGWVVAGRISPEVLARAERIVAAAPVEPHEWAVAVQRAEKKPRPRRLAYALGIIEGQREDAAHERSKDTPGGPAPPGRRRPLSSADLERAGHEWAEGKA